MSQGPMTTQPSMQQNIGAYTGEPEEFRNLMVNYIPTSIEEGQLRRVFEQAGPVESVKIVYDRTSRQSRGYGFVKFYSAATAQQAVNQFNGFEMMNKRLKVTFAAAGKQKSNPNTNNMGGMHGNVHGNIQGYYQQGYPNNFGGFQPGMPHGYPPQGSEVVPTMSPHYVVPQPPQQQAPRQ